MKFLKRPSGSSSSINLSGRRYGFEICVLVLLAQLVTVFAIASTANTMGVEASPVQAVFTFASMLVLFAVFAMAAVFLLRAANWVLKIPAADGLTKGQKNAFAAIKVIAALAIFFGALYMTRGIWAKAEYLAMLPVPLFYGAVGLYVWRRTSRVSIVRGAEAYQAERYDDELGESGDLQSSATRGGDPLSVFGEPRVDTAQFPVPTPPAARSFTPASVR